VCSSDLGGTLRETHERNDRSKTALAEL